MTYPRKRGNTSPLRHDLYLTKQCFTRARIETNNQNVPNLWSMPTTWTFEHHGKGTLVANIVIWTIHEVGIQLYGQIKWMARYTNNQYIIVAMDYIMKWVEAKTFKNNITKNIANFLYEHIITRFGCLAHLVSD